MQERGRAWPLFAMLATLAAAFVARRWLDVVEVSGSSMAPTLRAGDRLLVERLTYRLRPPRPGDVAIAPDPRHRSRELVKRVTKRNSSGVTLRGDNPAASTDARAFGTIPTADVQWRAVLRYWPPDRIGRLQQALVPVEEGGEPACAFPEALIAG